MLDVNNFEQLRIGLATADGIRDVVQRRGQKAGDDQLPHAAPGKGRPFLREDLRSHQGLGVLLRQVQAGPLSRASSASAAASRSPAPRSGASAWATSSSLRPWCTSGTCAGPAAGWPTFSWVPRPARSSRRSSSRRSSISPPTSSRGSTRRGATPTCPTSRSSWTRSSARSKRRARPGPRPAVQGARGRAGQAGGRGRQGFGAEGPAAPGGQGARPPSASPRTAKSSWSSGPSTSSATYTAARSSRTSMLWRELARPLSGLLPRWHGGRGHRPADRTRSTSTKRR